MPTQAISPLQIYTGYSEQDIQLFNNYSEQAKPKLVSEPGYITDFLGVKTYALSLADSQRVYAGKILPIPVPGDYHAEAIEYVGLLKSVLAARRRGCYRVMELGAGWGPWIVSGAVAARSLGIRDIRMVGVEADKAHYDSMVKHLADNGFRPGDHKLFFAAVGAQPGKAAFPVIDDSTNQWGARPARTSKHGIDQKDQAYLGGLASRMMEVEVLGINNLLDLESRWDLLHIDIQGWEYDVCKVAIGQFSTKVCYIIIGTHSRILDGDIFRLFHDAGWILENEKPTRFEYRRGAPPESMTLADGAQVWRNPFVD